METMIRSFHLPESQELALELLHNHQVIAAPTDTVYGLMCRYDSIHASEQLYTIKSRPPQKAIPVLIGERAQLTLLTPKPVPAVANLLINHFWPGPLTIVLPALPGLPPVLTAGNLTIAIRMPAHTLLLDLIRRSGPLAATSANRSGQPEAHSAAEVAHQLPGLLPLILDDEPSTGTATAHNVPSTIVQVSDNGGQLVLLRTGPIADRVRHLIAQSAAGVLVDANRS